MFLYTNGMGFGKIYFAPFDVVLSDTDTVRPDLLFVSKERLHIITADNVQGAPDLGGGNPIPVTGAAGLDG